MAKTFCLSDFIYYATAHKPPHPDQYCVMWPIIIWNITAINKHITQAFNYVLMTVCVCEPAPQSVPVRDAFLRLQVIELMEQYLSQEQQREEEGVFPA